MFDNAISNHRKESKTQFQRKRTMQIEALEERALLSAAPLADNQDLAAAYSSSFPISDNANCIDAAELTVENLNAASDPASQTTSGANAIQLSGSAQDSTSAVINNSTALSSEKFNKTYAITKQIDETRWAYVTGLSDPDSYWIESWDYTGNCWGMVSDAEKSRYYPTDDNLCWAATASNMLWYTGWVNSYVSDEDGIALFTNADYVEQYVFQYFTDHFTDGTGNVNNANLWFLTGRYTPIEQGASQLKMDGGGFYPNVKPQDVIGYCSASSYASVSLMDKLSELLHNGYGIGLKLNNSNTSIGHEVTVWGYVIDERAEGEARYQALLISDPDDENLGVDSYTYLTSIELTWNSEHGRYYLANYHDNNYYIDGLYTLAPLNLKYDSHDVACLRAFFEQADESGVKNGTRTSRNYNANDPSTWDVTWALVDGVLNVRTISFANSDLVGSLDVSGCKALRTVNFEFNQLTSLNTSGCTKLEWIYINDNQLTSLDASGCTELYQLQCYNNQIVSLNASGCTELKKLDCSDNQLVTLNISGCTQLDDLDFGRNYNLETLDASGCKSLGWLQTDFSLQTLTTLNVTGCTSLGTLNCSYNQLTALDLSGCVSLTTLNCSNNQLSSLDVSGCTALKSLNCEYNQLTDLVLSQCTMLSRVDCKNNPPLERIVFNRRSPNIYISYWLSEVFDANGERASTLCYDSEFHSGYAFPLTGKNYGHSITIEAESSAMSLPVPKLSASVNGPTTVSVGVSSGVDYALGYLFEYSTDPGFSGAGGVSVSTTSTLISDLRPNTEYYFRVKALGSDNYNESSYSEAIKRITPPIELEAPSLSVSTVGPESISVTVGRVGHASAYLLKYWVDSYYADSWATLILPAGTTTIENLYPKTQYYFSVMALGSGDYSNSEYSSRATTTTEVGYVSSELLRLRAFFEQTDSNGVKNGVKINSNYDANDPTTWTCVTWEENDGINYAKELNINEKELVGSLDLSGFAALEEVVCYINNLTSINVAGCTALDYLNCCSNDLTSLNVTGCTALEYLYCFTNKLTSLNASGCAKLEYLYCYKNQLTSLNLSGCYALRTLDCSINQLASLNLSTNVNLRTLYCESNQFSSLDLSKNVNLQKLTCWNSQLHVVGLSSTGRSAISIYTPGVWVFKDKNNEEIGTSYANSDNDYYYRLSSYTSLPVYATNGAQTVIFTGSPIGNMAAPSLSVAVTGSNSVSVNVGAVPNASEYRLEYSSNPNFTNPKIMTVSAGDTPISGLTASTTYYFRAMTVGTGVYYDSDYSATVSATTDKVKLRAPTLSVTITGYDSASVTVGEVANASGYRLEYSTNPNFTNPVVRNVSAGSTPIYNLASDTTYYFHVMAIGNGDNSDSDYSATVSAKTEIEPIQLDAPVLNVVDSGSSIIATWSTVENASSYTVEYKLDNSQWSVLAVTGTTSYSIGRAEGKHSFRVKANGTGIYLDSDYSSVKSVSIGNVLVAEDDFVNPNFNTPVRIYYLANDDSSDWSATNVTFKSNPIHGSFVINADRSITYTPNTNFFGLDTINYELYNSSGKRSSATIVIDVGLPVAASVQKELVTHTPSMEMPPSVESLTDWDVCYVELWGQGVQSLNASSTVVTLTYNPTIYASVSFSNCADGVVMSASQGVQLTDGRVQVKLTIKTTQSLASETDNLYLGTMVLTPSTAEGSGVADAFASEPVCALDGVDLTTAVTAMPYDIVRNGEINVDDFVAFATVYGYDPETMSPDHPYYEQTLKANFDKEGSVDVNDFISFAMNFGASKVETAKPMDPPVAQSALAKNEELVEDCSEFIIEEFSEEASAIEAPLLVFENKLESTQTLREAFSAALLDLYDNQERADLSDFSEVLADSRTDSPTADFEESASPKTTEDAIDVVLQEELLAIDWKSL